MSMRWILVTLVSVAACSRSHPVTLQEVSVGQDCVTCHRANYDATTSPVHAGVIGTTCADCHSMTAWQPALGGGHPEANFPIASGAHKVACQSCHDLALGNSAGGQNTDCLTCHPRAPTDPKHAGVTDYAFDAAKPHFCLSCHPDGTAAKHPEDRFPITTGPHRNIQCNDCHDSTLGSSAGGMNANCTGCHSGEHAMATMVSKHRDVGSFVWSDSDKKFCLMCHSDGTTRGN